MIFLYNKECCPRTGDVLYLGVGSWWILYSGPLGRIQLLGPHLLYFPIANLACFPRPNRLGRRSGPISNNFLFFLCFTRWQAETRFGFSLVRLPPNKEDENRDFKENEEVEVLSRSNDQESCGWWRAVIKVSFRWDEWAFFCFWATNRTDWPVHIFY